MVKGLEDQIQQHQDEIKTLEQHLIETRKALVAEKQTREMLAQDMKRSFMRGVCALNLEAMQVLLTTRIWNRIAQDITMNMYKRLLNLEPCRCVQN